MTLRGIAVPESVTDQHLLTAAIGDREPDVVAIWAPKLDLDITTFDAVIARGIQPIVYAETVKWTPDDILGTPGDILTGKHDATIDDLAFELIGTDTVLRLNQEPNGPGLRAPWNDWTPQTYIDVFVYISERIRAIAPRVRMAYCIVWRGMDHADDFERWYPGDACQVVGFDSYVTSPTQRPSRIWPVAVRTIRETTDKPIWVFEAGVARYVPFRARRLREMLAVPGIRAVVYFDIDLVHHGQSHVWSLTERLRRLWRGR